MSKIIAYYRVSTKKQGKSGLGLEGQQAAVESYCKGIGGGILASYFEVESGKRTDRPELAKALGHARRAKATLVVAKLDRLVRNYQFLREVEQSGVDFIACDNPNANKMTIRILAVVAEDEAERTSQRTKDALQAAKARGTLLGSARPGHWEGREQCRLAGLVKARIKAILVRKHNAAVTYADLLPELTSYRTSGLSLAAIAAKLNERGQTTRRGRPWNPVQVSRVLERASDKS